MHIKSENNNMQYQNELNAKINTLQTIFNLQLSLPVYQRPYKWQPKHVKQLLNDLEYEFSKKEHDEYRLGSIILHNYNNKLDIIDGQQRIITLMLILNNLGIPKDTTLALKEHEFENQTSIKNIKINYKAIIDWFSVISFDKNKFRDFILNKCTVVTITTFNLSEAFQLFDSQNARGLPLEPYDLLKAYHLREMNQTTNSEEKVKCIQTWEENIEKKKLDLISSHLYRIRKWARNEAAGKFSKDTIDEFKGISPQNIANRKYTYLKKYLFIPIEDHSDFPYNITQDIINGIYFFNYVSYYINLYDSLFVDFDIKETEAIYKEHCLYPGHLRMGDTYVRGMFEAVYMFHIDKFGQSIDQNAFSNYYRWCYWLRTKQTRVMYSSIDKYIMDGPNYFKKIQYAYTPNQVTPFSVPNQDRPYIIEEVTTILNNTHVQPTA